MTENTGSHKGFFQKVHIPTLVICLGCVLTASFGHRGWGTLVCREWACLERLRLFSDSTCELGYLSRLIPMPQTKHSMK